ncbi:MAG: tetratricopeptide repeat protein [Epsilonproteobacteria bacterium]|nr:tetratricopeptide repeat protein [Campylobacterota bacterium]
MKKTLKTRKTQTVPMTEPHEIAWYYWLIIPLFLLSSTLFFYSPSLPYSFQFDDIANITKHFELRHYRFWDLFFSGPRWISYWLNSIQYALGKFDPYFYRLFNICLHSLNGILLFFILALGLSKRNKHDFFKQHAMLLAIITSILFLLHPVQTQTVSYVIQGQLEGLAAFFMLSMTLLCMVVGYSQQKMVRLGATIALLALTPFACCTKEIAIITPALLLLVDWFLIAQGEYQAIKKRLWLHGCIMLIVATIFIYFFKIDFFLDIFGLQRIAINNCGNIITHTNSLITPFAYFISQFKVILHYLWIFVWPFSISVEYDWVLSRSFFSLDAFLPFLMLSAITYCVVRLLQRDGTHMITFGFCWFFLCILPRSSIIPSPELLVDYKTYMASCGWLFLLATAIVACGAWAQHRLALVDSKITLKTYVSHACAVMLVIPLGFATMQRNRVWRSGLEFWGNILENAPGKARVQNNYGVELLQQCARPHDSIAYFSKAIALDPQYYDPYNNLAVAYLHTQQPGLALQTLQAGLKINPNHPEGYNNLASFLLQQGEYAQAESALFTALQLRPYYGKAHYNLGRLYCEQGNYELAWNHFRDACMKCDLDDDMGFSAFAKLSLILHKYDDAIFGYTKTLALLPNDQDSLFNLGNAYFLAQQHDQALHTYERLLSHYPDDLRGWYNCAEVYFVKGYTDKALTCFKKVASHTKTFPSYYVRIAQCYAQLGQYQAAYKALDCISIQDVPQNVITMAQEVRQHITKAERQLQA